MKSIMERISGDTLGVAQDASFSSRRKTEMRCLFVTHMWGGAAPETGESVTIPHLIETFDEWGKGTRELGWTDVAHDNAKDVRVAVCEAAEDFRPDVAVLKSISSAALADLNVPADVMRPLLCTVSVFLTLPSLRSESSAHRMPLPRTSAST